MYSRNFHTINGQKSDSIEVSENFYLWLAKSDFSKIGKSVKRKILTEDEEAKLDVVPINGEKGNRQKFISFFNQEIVREGKAMLDKLGDSPSTKEYQKATYWFGKLYELLFKKPELPICSAMIWL
jgi:hypothetical protein